MIAKKGGGLRKRKEEGKGFTLPAFVRGGESTQRIKCGAERKNGAW